MNTVKKLAIAITPIAAAGAMLAFAVDAGGTLGYIHALGVVGLLCITAAATKAVHALDQRG